MEEFNNWYHTTYKAEGLGSDTMDVYESLKNPALEPITCIEFHTAGEPTRIVVSGYPDVRGTLLQQRAQALARYDHIRRRIILEPRGHANMYGAVLRQKTELTESGEAHIGVLFLTNEGYSTMCGHATMALGRLLIDTHDTIVFPARENLRFDAEGQTTNVTIHAPCGLIETSVPTTPDGKRSDPSRPVSFLSVPSFATGIDVSIPIPTLYQWSAIQGTGQVSADFCYGGAYYCVLSSQALGFTGPLAEIDLEAASKATSLLKAAINNNENLRHLFAHAEQDGLGFLYGIILVDDVREARLENGCRGSELGLCFFSDQQIDRSPTGSGVAARVALALAEGRLGFADKWEYHSILTRQMKQSGFIGSIHEIQGIRNSWPVARVRVEGNSYYTGSHRFVFEAADALGNDGFLFDKLLESGKQPMAAGRMANVSSPDYVTLKR